MKLTFLVNMNDKIYEPEFHGDENIYLVETSHDIDTPKVLIIQELSMLLNNA